MTNPKHTVQLVWVDDQKRTMSLDESYIHPSMYCHFDNKDWCLWRKVNNGRWSCIDGSRPESRQGNSPSKAFIPLLDKAYEELITHKAIETFVLITE